MPVPAHYEHFGAPVGGADADLFANRRFARGPPSDLDLDAVARERGGDFRIGLANMMKIPLEIALAGDHKVGSARTIKHRRGGVAPLRPE